MTGLKAWIAAWLTALFIVCIPARAAPEEVYTYRVKSGDTLIGFSNRYLANAQDYLKLRDINRLADADLLRPGKPLLVPYALLKFTPISAQIAAHSGDVSVRAGTRRVEISIGLAIKEGMIIETGRSGFVTMSLANGSRLSVPSLSQLRVVRLRRYVLTGGNDIDFSVDKGRAETAVTPFKDRVSRFRLRTPSAVSAVRGTTFRVGFDDVAKSSVSEVVEGSVGVGTSGSSKETAIPGGFGAAISRSGDLNKEKLLPPPALIDPGATQQGADVRFTAKPAPTEKGYHVQIAKDAGFVDVVASERSLDPTLTFSGLADGRYFVRAMAIASSGLEGLSETTSFRRQLASASAERVPGAMDAFRFAWMTQGADKKLYRFQFFNTASPALPMIDEAALEGPALMLGGLKPGVYQWRVSIKPAGGSQDDLLWTPFQKLTVTE